MKRCPRCAELTAMWQKDKQCAEHYGDPARDWWLWRALDWVLRSPR